MFEIFGIGERRCQEEFNTAVRSGKRDTSSLKNKHKGTSAVWITGRRLNGFAFIEKWNFRIPTQNGSLFWIAESDDPPLKKSRSLSRKVDQSDDSDSSHNFHRDDPQIGVCLQYLRFVHDVLFSLIHSLLAQSFPPLVFPSLCFRSFGIHLCFPASS